MKTLKTLHMAISKNMARFSKCAIRGDEVVVPTTCVLPVFDSLYVHVKHLGDRYMVHDVGATLINIMENRQQLDVVDRIIRPICKIHDVDFKDWSISWECDDLEWVSNGIKAVAAAAVGSADLAFHESGLLERSACRDEPVAGRLADAIYAMLAPSLADASISRKYQHCGKSGRRYEFDLAVKRSDQLTLIETVSPHDNSVSSKFVALADVPSESRVRKIAAHDNDLSEEDILLLRSVAAVASPDDLGRMVAG